MVHWCPLILALIPVRNFYVTIVWPRAYLLIIMNWPICWLIILISIPVYCYCNVEAIMQFLIIKNVSIFIMMCESIWQGAVQDSYNEKYDTITAQYSTNTIRTQYKYSTTQYKYNTNASVRALRKREPTTSSPRQPHVFLMPRCFWNPSPLTLLLTCSLTHKKQQDMRPKQPPTIQPNGTVVAARNIWITINKTLHSTCPYTNLPIYSYIIYVLVSCNVSRIINISR